MLGARVFDIKARLPIEVEVLRRRRGRGMVYVGPIDLSGQYGGDGICGRFGGLGLR